MCDRTLEFFWNRKQLTRRDAAEVSWSHAVNSRRALTRALAGPTLMIEADVIMRGRDPQEPIMAHPPDTDSDITLREWLEQVKETNKGLKLDFKSLEAVPPSLALLKEVLAEPNCPVWINADILCGPGGKARPLEPQAFLSAASALPAHTVLSLGWTTGWTAAAENPGYGSEPSECRLSCAALTRTGSRRRVSYLLGMSRMRTVLTYTAVVACVGIGYGMWTVISPGEERKRELLKNFPESNPMRMEESMKKTAMFMQVLKKAAESSEIQARGPEK